MQVIDFSEYQFRASQSSKLLVGTIGITELQAIEIKDLEAERDTGLNANGRKVKWTNTKSEKLKKLTDSRDNPRLPATVEKELRKIYRSETHNRNFEFTNKFVQKGIDQEEEAITTLQAYLNLLGIIVKFKKNEKQLRKGKFRGTPDIDPIQLIINNEKKKVGFDTKASWNLDTFPFPEDELDSDYDTQNRVYTYLTDADMWITAYVLVNCTEHLLHNEKMKWFYAMGSPEQIKEPFKYAAYVNKAKEVEKDLVFDWDRFAKVYPHHQMEWTEKEWKEAGNDIPIEKRVVLKATYPDAKKWKELEERADIGRKHLVSLQEEEFEPLKLLQLENVKLEKLLTL